MSSVERFKALFTGSLLSHGEWHVDRTPSAVTRHEPPSDQDYQLHLDGRVGLGVVPVNQEGKCFFGAIDIDVDTINHAQLLDKVRQYGLPLNVCRSKSGGAHLYAFNRTPLQANEFRAKLASWATTLGYGSAEIFPKQTKVTADNVGNWINLPYFGSDETTRYCLGEAGAKTLQDFLNTVEYYDPHKTIETPALDEPEMPPCLRSLLANGISQGGRNQGLFNYAVFYRKSQPAIWEKKTKELNQNYFSPPLDTKEVDGVISSAARQKYQYTCDQHPISEFCQREACLKLPFGISHMPWDEHGSYDDFTVVKCRKLTTDPPKYIVEINGKDITLAWDEFFEFRKFRSLVGKQLDIIITGMKQPSWEQTVRRLLSEKVEITAPADASTMGLVIDKLHEFLTLRERATEVEDLLRGLPFERDDQVLFRIGDFKRYLQGFKLDKLEGSELFLAIRRDGATSTRATVAGRQIAVWSYPLLKVNEQTVGFKVPEFTKAGDEL